jgi:hypothetical protein
VAPVARRGIALAGVLLTLCLLLVLALAYLGEQLHRYRSGNALRYRLLAQQLAELGWRETRMKLLKDSQFPPPADPEQSVFTFSEPVLDAQGQRQGLYHVHIHRQYAHQEKLLLIQIEGEVAADRLSQARYRLSIEWDLAWPPRRPFRGVVVDSGF